VTAAASHVEVAMDASHFGAITAIAEATAAKQDQLTEGTVQGGFQLLDQNAKEVRAIKGVAPVNVAIRTTWRSSWTKTRSGPAVRRVHQRPCRW
jgi:hypothetical protein